MEYFTVYNVRALTFSVQFVEYVIRYEFVKFKRTTDVIDIRDYSFTKGAYKWVLDVFETRTCLRSSTLRRYSSSSDASTDAWKVCVFLSIGD